MPPMGHGGGLCAANSCSVRCEQPVQTAAMKFPLEIVEIRTADDGYLLALEQAGHKSETLDYTHFGASEDLPIYPIG